jgi:hypothetical protein
MRRIHIKRKYSQRLRIIPAINLKRHSPFLHFLRTSCSNPPTCSLAHTKKFAFRSIVPLGLRTRPCNHPSSGIFLNSLKQRNRRLTMWFIPRSHSIWLFLVLQFFGMPRRTMTAFIPSSLQSGPDLAGSSFAASAVYDAVTHSVTITGSSFGRYFMSGGDTTSTIARETSNCFVATVLLPSDSTSSSSSIRWNTKQVLGDKDDLVNEACSMALYYQQRRKLIVLGFSEPGGFVDDLYDGGALNQVAHYGVLFDMNVESNQNPPFDLIGGRVLQQASVTYPIMATSALKDDWIYVVSQETDNMSRQDLSDDDQFNSTNIDVSLEVDPQRFFRFGDDYKLSIAQFKTFPRAASSNGLVESIQRGWKQVYGTTNNDPVRVAGIAEMDDFLVVVGCTSGTGNEFGGTTDNISEGTLTGFITKFNKYNGTLVVPTQANEKYSRRIQTDSGDRVWTAGMCTDLNDAEHVYVVGATEGDLNSATSLEGVDAYVMKINTITLADVWIKQISGVDNNSMIRAISCAVSSDGKFIWVGGVAQENAVILNSGTMESFGGDDVFVAKLSTDDGNLKFLRQIGSTDDDGLAMRGGLTIDLDGNCIVVGNTYGSMYRVREARELDDEAWISDVFVTTISGDDGSISYPVAHPDFNPQPGPGSDGTDVNSPQDTNNTGSDESSSGMGKGAIAVIVLAGVGFLAFAMFARGKSKLNRDVTTDRAHVIQFLNDFDVEDIDLKHSATGGWHCSYSNDLANGRNRRAERGSSFNGLSPLERSLSSPVSDKYLTAPLNSSLLDDSLFMDDSDSESGLGGGFSESRSKHRLGYDGLMDAYNATWDDKKLDDQTADVWGKEIL